MTDKNVLLFLDSSEQTSALTLSLAQLNFYSILVHEVESAQKVLENKTIDLIITKNYLPNLSLKSSTKTPSLYIYDGKTEVSDISLFNTIFDLNDYEEHIFKISLAMKKDFKELGLPYNLMAQQQMIKSLWHLMDRQKGPALELTLSTSVEKFCVKGCPFISTRNAPDFEQGSYQLVTILDERGHLYCKHLSSCKLRDFEKFAKEQDSSRTERKNNDYFFCKEDDFKKNLLDLSVSLKKEIDFFFEWKNRYCTTKCEKIKKGIDFKVGDVLISKWQDFLKNDSFYCVEADCPLNDFFRFKIFKVVTRNEE